jgi:hypothetical protein
MTEIRPITTMNPSGIVSHHQIEVVADPGRNPLGAYS